MRVPVRVHNFANACPGAIGPDDTAAPIAAVYGKTNDGLNWQGRRDAHAAEINGLPAVVRAEREIYGPQEIEYMPWGVVHGRREGNADQALVEGLLAGQVARAAAGPGERATCVVDLEPHYHAGFPAFWRDDLGAGPEEVAAFVGGFIEEGGEDLWLAPDARNPHMAPVSFRAWTQHDVVLRVLPMVYFTDFRQEPEAALDRALMTLREYGWPDVRTVHPVLPGDAAPAAMLRAIRYARGLGCGGVSVWHRGNLRSDTAAAIAALLDPWVSAPPVPKALAPGVYTLPGGHQLTVQG